MLLSDNEKSSSLADVCDAVLEKAYAAISRCKKYMQHLSVGAVLSAGALGLSIFDAQSARAATPSRPANIIFILADDLGWTDLNCRNADGSPTSGGAFDSRYYQTPNLAALRKAGVRFTRAYATCPVCQPTRVSILTGKYQNRLHMTKNDTVPLSLSEITIPEALDTGGIDYVSAFVGKWHTAGPEVMPAPTNYYPHRQGFDYSIGSSWIGGLPWENYLQLIEDQLPANPKPIKPLLSPWSQYNWNTFNPYGENFWTGGWPVSIFPGLGNPPSEHPHDYLDHSLTTRALQVIQNCTDPARNHPHFGQPYFLYLSFYSVHRPIPGMLPAFTDNPETSDQHQNKYYASMIKEMDHQIGRIMEILDDDDGYNMKSQNYDFNMPDNTYIIFYSDNGGRINTYFDDYDWNNQKYYPKRGNDHADHPWSNRRLTSNAPLKLGKGQLFEGGIRVPMMVAGPAHRIAPDQTCDIPVSSIDIFPTILNLAYPDKFDQIMQNHPAVDGVSLLPLLEQNPANDNLTREALFSTHHEFIAGEWFDTHTITIVDPNHQDYGYKLKQNGNDQYSLYNLWTDGIWLDDASALQKAEDDAWDLTERHDLAAAEPLRKIRLTQKLHQWSNQFKPYIRGELDQFQNQIYRATIQSCIDHTNAARGLDTIIVPPGTYHENLRFHHEGGITLQSIDPDNSALVAATVIMGSGGDAAHSGCTIEINQPNCFIFGLTISGGYHDGDGGGGIDSNDYNTTIDRCIIEHNFCSLAGGGIQGCKGTISNCIIRNNFAAAGGGGLAGCPGTIKNCLIVHNKSERGAALNNCDGIIVNCTIVGNYAVSEGVLRNCDGVITNTIIWGNTPVSDYQCSADYTYCCLAWAQTGTGNINSAPGFTHTFTALEIVPDDSDQKSDIDNDLSVIHVGNPNDYRINDFIEYNNDNIPRKIIALSPGSITITPHLLYPSQKNDVICRWQSLSRVTEDYHLQISSACIDAGDNSALDPLINPLDKFDLDGRNRFLDLAPVKDRGAGSAPLVDIGAYEFAGRINS